MISALVGPNRFALQHSLQKIRADFASEHGELAVESLDAEEVELQDIRAALQSVSLFTPAKLVIVRTLSNNKQAAENIEKLLTDTPEDAQLLLVEPKPDKRSSYYKALKKHAKVQEFPELDEMRLAQWLIDEAKARGGELSRSDAQYLFARVGTGQAKLYTELRKLIDYDHKISRANIDTLADADPKNTVFQLLEAVFSGQLDRALNLYENLRIGGVQPQMILAMVVWQMHLVALISSAGNRAINEIAADSGAKPYTLGKSQLIAEQLSAKDIKLLLSDIEDLDRRLKTQPIDPDDAIRNLLASITISS